MGQIKILTKDEHEARSIERMEADAEWQAYQTWKEMKHFLEDESTLRELDGDFAREIIETAYRVMNKIEDELERRDAVKELHRKAF